MRDMSRKMTIFDDIVGPIKDALSNLVSTVEKPIKIAVSLFGKVITFTRELIESFLKMIEDLRTMFNARNIEQLFLSPFKKAALDTMEDVDALYKLIIQASGPSTDGVKDELMIPLNAMYIKMKSGMGFMTSAMGDLLTKLEQEGQRVAHSIYSDFNRVKASLESFPVEIGILKQKIGEEFQAVTSHAFSVLPDIPSMVETAGADAFHAVKKSGQVVGADFTNFEASTKRRFENENTAIDLFYMVLIGGILIALVSIFMITKSVALLINILIMVVIALVVYSVVEIALGVI